MAQLLWNNVVNVENRISAGGTGDIVCHLPSSQFREKTGCYVSVAYAGL